MGSEGQQDIEMAILTALLKGELSGDSDAWLLSAGLAQGFVHGQKPHSLFSCQEPCLLVIESRASQTV